MICNTMIAAQSSTFVIWVLLRSSCFSLENAGFSEQLYPPPFILFHKYFSPFYFDIIRTSKNELSNRFILIQKEKKWDLEMI